MRVNLWELITRRHCDAVHERDPDIQRWKDVIGHLTDSAQMHGQEFSIEPVEEGWLIEIFTCYDYDHDEDGYVVAADVPHYYVLIPKRGGIPIISKKWPMDVIDALAQIDLRTGEKK
jgi:hypothetical protein